MTLLCGAALISIEICFKKVGTVALNLGSGILWKSASNPGNMHIAQLL